MVFVCSTTSTVLCVAVRLTAYFVGGVSFHTCVKRRNLSSLAEVVAGTASGNVVEAADRECDCRGDSEGSKLSFALLVSDCDDG